MTGSGVSPTRIEALVEYLEGLGIPHEVVEHDHTETALAEARATGQRTEQVAKTVVLHGGKAHILVVVPASERVDMHKVRELLGANRSLRLASEKELSADFPEFEVGALPPVGPMLPSAEIVDRRLLDQDRVLCAGGDHEHGIVLDPRELVRATDARVADVCEEP